MVHLHDLVCWLCKNRWFTWLLLVIVMICIFDLIAAYRRLEVIVEG